MSPVNASALRLTAARLKPAGRGRQRGMSIVELMVGVAIGLFVLAGATMVASTQLADNRKMLLETQLQQDMRATMDIIGRDLRRAGYWAHSYQNVWPDGNAGVGSNPYRGITATNTLISYQRSEDERRRFGGQVGMDNDSVDTDEQVGFRLSQNGQAIEMLVGAGNWQSLTDPNVMRVTQFNVNLTTQSLPTPCGVQCPALGPGGCPLVLNVRNAAISLVAQAPNDPTVVRSVQTNLRLRNDVFLEVCP